MADGAAETSEHLRLTLPDQARLPAARVVPDTTTTAPARTEGGERSPICREGSASGAPTSRSVASTMEGTPGADNAEMRRARWRRVATRLGAGQAASIAVASTGIFTTLLVNRDASVPALQSLFAYVTIAVLFVPLYIHRVVLSSGNGSSRRRRHAAALPGDDAAASAATSSPPPNVAERLLAAIAPRHFPAWRYLLIALFDFTANTLAVWAYTYTDIISVQLLDCFTIPCVMVLAYFVFHRRPQWWQMVGGVVAVVGLAALVLLDNLHDTTTADAPNPLLGDALCLAASMCYAVSNTACEALLKSDGPDGGDDGPAREVSEGGGGGAAAVNIAGGGDGCDTAAAGGYGGLGDDASIRDGFIGAAVIADDADDVALAKFVQARAHSASRVDLAIEYLAYLSCFGALFAGVTCIIVHDEVASAMSKFDDRGVALGQLGFAAVMVVTYSAMPALFAIASATFANLSLLSADIYAILLNLLCFGRSPQPLFAIPFAVIIVGLVVYEGVVDWGKLLRSRRLCRGGGGRVSPASPG